VNASSPFDGQSIAMSTPYAPKTPRTSADATPPLMSVPPP
jgi:hypothetical protein